MDVKMKFLGAAQSVTGSKYLLEVDQFRLLFDCGLFQGKKELRLRNWNPLPVRPEQLHSIIITHAHIDHVGYLPRLVREGFRGKIICTRATAELMKIMLLDAAKLQEEEALFAFRQGYSKHSKPEPLFTTQDAERVAELVTGYPFEKEISVVKGVSVQFHNAGHILGAAIVEATLTGNNQTKKIVFSGDLGRYDDPIMHPPKELKDADILVVESTYGNRINPVEHVEADLTRILNEAFQRNGAVVIPAFAVGRTQSLIYYLVKLMDQKAIPSVPIFIDSPMAISVTDLYERHHELNKIEVKKEGGRLISVFDSPHVHFCKTPDSSKALNHLHEPMIIISASGMCTGGRILHHLYHRLPNPNDTFLFAGYQAESTRGRDLLEGAEFIKVFGEMVRVKCNVREVGGLSAHADQIEILQWLNGFTSNPKMTFITHGELEGAKALAKVLEDQKGWKSFIPVYLEAFELFQGI